MLSDDQQQKFFELIEDKQRLPREFGGFERLQSLDLTDEKSQLGESMKQHRKEHMKHSRGHKRPFI